MKINNHLTKISVFCLVVGIITAFVIFSNQKGKNDFRVNALYGTCTGCATASCGSCSSTTSGYRCSCSGSYGDGSYVSCAGVADGSCTITSPTATLAPTPTVPVSGVSCTGCTIKLCTSSIYGNVSGSCSGWANSRCVYDNNGACVEIHDSYCQVNGSWSYSSGTVGAPSCNSCQGSAMIGEGHCETCGNSPIEVYGCTNPTCNSGETCYSPYYGGQSACSGFNHVVGTTWVYYDGYGGSTCGCGASTANLCCVVHSTSCACASGSTSTTSCSAGYHLVQANSTNCGSEAWCGSCVIDPPCGTCSASCNTYSITGTSCVTVNCPITAACNSCQKCNGTTTAGSCVADATKNVNGANGVCSGANGSSVCNTPSASCSTGTPSGVSGSGPWTWTCGGLAATCAGTTGTTANCSASKTSTVNGDWSAWSACASCSRTQSCGTANSCGSQNCTPTGGIITDNACGNVNGGWSVWGSCSASCGPGTQNHTCNNPAPVCNGTTCPGSASQACNLGCCPVNGSNGVCGSANGVVTASAPSTNLCSTGVDLGVTTGSGVYTWTCYGITGSCGGLSGTNASCSAPSLLPPTYNSFELRNNSNTVVPVEGGNINQVCQSVFAGRLVRFVVTATDPNGAADIASVQLRVGGQTYTNNYASTFNGTAIFDVIYPAVVASTTTIIETNITDSTSLSTGWITVGRSLKVWDCKVPVSGTLYDGSKAVFEVISCAAGSSDFVTAVGSSMAYGLTYTGIALDTDKIMGVSSPNYSSGANSLYWGAQYRANFTNVNGNTPVMRYPGNNTCNNTNASFVIDNAGQFNVDPYAANPSIVLNFSSILSQFPWFQASGGGVVAKVSITDNIPNTCVSPCKPNVSLSSGTSAPNGLVAAQTITKGSGSFGDVNNWGVNTNVIGSDYSYKYFYNEYFVKLGQGKTYDVGTTGSINLSQIVTDTGGTGVVLVNGSVTVNTNNTVPAGSFFMLVASKDINVSSTVNNIQGIFITDNSFAVTGNSDTQLKIDGSIYSRNSVRMARGFTTGTLNNRNPAMVVNYRPDFIFSMPGKLTKILSGWKEGI